MLGSTQCDYGEIQIIPDNGVRYFAEMWKSAIVYKESEYLSGDWKFSKLLSTILSSGMMSER